MGHAATHPVLLDRVHGEEIWHGVLQKMLEQIGKSAKRQKLFSDELLLEAMITESGLIEAWEILSPPNTRANLNSEEIAKTADLLESIASRDDVPAGDDGPIYLAAVASLLRMREMDHALVLANSPGGDGDVSKIKKKYGLMIQAILKPHLLPHEIDGSDEDAVELSKWAVRYLYVRLYQTGRYLAQVASRPLNID